MMVSRPLVGASGVVTYRPDPSSKRTMGGILIFFGLFLLVPSFTLLRVAGGVATAMGLLMLGVACVLGGAGVLVCFRQWRGLDRVTVTSTRITVASIRGTQWAEWSSLTAFVLGTWPAGRRPEMACARAGIIGPRVSANLLGKGEFVLPDDACSEPAETIVDELNALRPRSHAHGAMAEVRVKDEPRSWSVVGPAGGWILVGATIAFVWFFFK
jgi:hypothetical protein